MSNAFKRSGTPVPEEQADIHAIPDPLPGRCPARDRGPGGSPTASGEHEAVPDAPDVPDDLQAFKLQDGLVLRAKVELLLNSIPMALLSSFLAAGTSAWLLRKSMAAWKLDAWLLLLALVHLVRLVGWNRMRGSTSTTHSAKCLTWLRTGVLATGLTWAAVPLFMYPPDALAQLVLATTLAAICGAGVSELTADALSASLFVVPILTATILRLLGSPVESIQTLGVMGTVFGAYLVVSARKTERIFLEIAYLRAKAAERIQIDEVTGLPNRAGLNRILRERIARARRYKELLVVGYIDLDDFKPVNDLYGHAAGDLVLRELGWRLQESLGVDGDVARVSGDEFVVVLRHVDAAHLQSMMMMIFDRMHEAVMEPFHLEDGSEAHVDMTMGVSLYPSGAEDADGLLRAADAAMYQLKRRKDERRQWWQFGVREVVTPEIESPIDPYGDEAAQRLSQIAPVLARIRENFIEAFYRSLEEDPQARSILQALDSRGLAHLKQRQAAHLEFLAAPGLTREGLALASRRIGQVHALVGVNTRMLVKALSLFRAILSGQIAAERLVASRRFRMFTIIDARLQDDLEEQIAIIEATSQAYMAYLSRPRSDRQTLWADAAQSELSALHALPGVVMVTLSRLNLQGEIVVELGAGITHPDLSQRLSHGDLRSAIDPTAAGGQTPTSIAWRTEAILRTDSCLTDPHILAPEMAAWLQMAADCGVHSNVSIPFVGRDRHVEGVLTIYGAYPRQFASDWMQQWATAVQRRLESIWLGCNSTQHMAISQARAIAFREILFAGGLEMFYQPIVDLRTGEVAKLEALARLRMPDGSIVAPSGFIPLLGGNELGRVFREGLGQALANLSAWSRQGLRLGVSLNLPPSVLSDVNCAAWIDDALRAHAVEPHRLTLELLEVQLDDDVAQTQEMDRLRALGVHLAMDDFGAGYSNIHRMASVHFEAIKIDQNLTRQFQQSPLETTTMLGTLIRLVRELGRDVIVEGLEDIDSMEAAAVLGARFGQGYAIARPMPAGEVQAWVREYRLPVDGQARTLRTSLGALAFQWQYTGFGASRHPLPASQCPLHDFLQTLGGESMNAQLWHTQVHHPGEEAEQASQKLMHWLARQAAARDLAAAGSHEAGTLLDAGSQAPLAAVSSS